MRFIESLVVLMLISSVGFGQNIDRFRREFDSWDKNKDGRLTKNELPKALQRNFKRVDADGDGFISRKEDAAFRNRARSRTNDQGLPKNAKVERNLSYIRNGHARQKLDIYYVPKSTGQSKTRPLVIWIHGGAWRAGSKDRCPATFLLSHGFAVASINYRLSQHAVFPAQINDCKSAIVWLRQNAKKYNLDKERFGVWGSSAGGHLSALVGTSANVKDLEPGSKFENQSKVQAVCDWFGPTDILKMNEQAGSKGTLDHDAPNSPESLLIGGTLQENKVKAYAVNPIRYISKDDPPFLIMHGDNDFLVPIQQSEMLHAALKKGGVESELIVIKGKGHGGFDPKMVRPKIVAFFEKHLKDRR